MNEDANQFRVLAIANVVLSQHVHRELNHCITGDRLAAALTQFKLQVVQPANLVLEEVVRMSPDASGK
jgi:hypothetical protein